MVESPLIARLENAPFTRWHAKARIVVGSATFFDAFNALALAFALPVLIKLWNITPAESGLLIGASYIGQLVGALLFSWLAEKFGRIPSAAIATALMSIMSLACALAGSFPALLAYRLVQGVGVGGEMPVAAAYISELSKARGRGKFVEIGGDEVGGYDVAQSTQFTDDSSKVPIPLFPRYRIRSVCAEAVHGEIVAPDRVTWKGAHGKVVVDAAALTQVSVLRDAFAWSTRLASFRFNNCR